MQGHLREGDCHKLCIQAQQGARAKALLWAEGHKAGLLALGGPGGAQVPVRLAQCAELLLCEHRRRCSLRHRSCAADLQTSQT